MVFNNLERMKTLNDLNLFKRYRPGGEIGRRTAFRWQRSQGCAGSNPVPGTD